MFSFSAAPPSAPPQPGRPFPWRGVHSCSCPASDPEAARAYPHDQCGPLGGLRISLAMFLEPLSEAAELQLPPRLVSSPFGGRAHCSPTPGYADPLWRGLSSDDLRRVSRGRQNILGGLSGSSPVWRMPGGERQLPTSRRSCPGPGCQAWPDRERPEWDDKCRCRVMPAAHCLLPTYPSCGWLRRMGWASTCGVGEARRTRSWKSGSSGVWEFASYRLCSHTVLS